MCFFYAHGLVLSLVRAGHFRVRERREAVPVSGGLRAAFIGLGRKPKAAAVAVAPIGHKSVAIDADVG